MLKQNKVIKKGFTLVETLLYLSLTSIIVLMITTIWITVADTRERSEGMSITESEATYLMSTMTQIIRNSSSITTPTATNSGTSLTLVMTTPAVNPTVLTLSGGNITITEGVGSPVTLNSSRVTVTSLTFRNLSRASTSGIVRIEMTLSYVNTTGKTSLNYSQTYYASASLR